MAVVGDDEHELDRLRLARQVELAVDVQTPVAAVHRRRAEGDLGALEHLLVDRLGDVGLIVGAEVLGAPGPVDDAQRARVGGQLNARLGRIIGQRDGGVPRRDLDVEVVAGHRRRPVLACVDGEGTVLGTQNVRARFDRHALT